jgi:mono/diheme cytochrome c family protein
MRKVIKWTGILVGGIVVLVIGLVVFILLAWDRPVNRDVTEMIAPMDEETLARGEYLYKYTLGCWDCHGADGGNSPDEVQAGGAEFDLSEIGPPGGFGVVYASNITPDPETGIGDWSDGEIVRAIREGIDPEGQILFPIMEAEWWNGLSDEDTLALVAYLRSLKPVHNKVQDNRFSFAAKLLIGLRIVNAQPVISKPVTAPTKGVTVEYGKYLATHASTCVGCHSPRDPNSGQFDLSRIFAGGLFPFPEEGFSTTGSNLTPDVGTGIGGWSEEDFMTANRLGLRPDGTVIIPFMPWPYYSKWSDDDLRAVWLYLLSLNPIEHQVPPSALTGLALSGEGSDRGQALFNVYCIICHGEQGINGPIASIELNRSVNNLDKATLIRMISEGRPDDGMPGFKKTLTREQINDIVAFFRTW